MREVAERAREYGSPDVIVICADVSKFEDSPPFWKTLSVQTL